MTDQAWVTLATNDSYSLGAMVLGTSLRRVNTTRQLVVMVTPGVSAPMRSVLESLFNLVVEVNVLDSQDTANLALLTRPELGITFTKLHCWRLVQYSKCVFLDADTLVLQNCDELFDREEFSAAPDAGWPDCFNSGVFVFKPSLDTYRKLLQFAIECGSFDGGDQGLLNSYFSDWSVSDISRHLPFIYNMVASAVYSYLPAYRVFAQNVKIAHFIGPEKPWLQQFDTQSGQVRPPPDQQHLGELLQAWWDIFRADIHLRLSPEMSTESGALMEQVQSTLTSHIPQPGDYRREEYYDPSTSHTAATTDSSYTANDPPPPDPDPEPSPLWPGHIPPIPPPPPVPVLLVAIQRYPPPPPTPRLESPPPPQIQATKSEPPPPPLPLLVESFPEISQRSESSHAHAQAQDSGQSEADDDSSKGLAGAYAKMSLEGGRSSEQMDYMDEMRKHAWESGHIDYLGQDSFDNIMKKIQASIAKGAEAKPRAKSPSPPKPAVVETPAPVVPAAEPAVVPVPTPAAPESAAPAPEAAPAVPTTPPAPEAVITVVPATPIATEAPQTQAAPAPVAEPVVAASAPPPESQPAPAPVAQAPAPEPQAQPAPAPGQGAPAPVATPTPEELEDARLAQERQAIEKKLSEQKRIAEQKLLEERAAAEAAAAAAAIAAAAAVSAVPAPPGEPPVAAAAPPTPPADASQKPAGAAAATAPGAAGAAPSGIPQPKAPPRKQLSKGIKKVVGAATFGFLEFF